MQEQEMSMTKVSLFHVVNNQLCPECGGQMKELDRRKEGSVTYVWLKCVKSDCDGQWFQKLTARTI